MTVEEYVSLRKKELDKLADHWTVRREAGDRGYQDDPPDATEWYEQELAFVEGYCGRQAP